MAYGVTPQGFIAKNFQTLLDEVAAAAKTELGEDTPTTPDSPFGQFANIFTASTKDTWDLGQAIASQQDRDVAEGIYLDYLAKLAGLAREAASGSTGDLLFTGKQGGFVAEFFPCADDLGRNVLTQDDLTLNRSACFRSTFSVAFLADNTDYTINVEGNPYTFAGGTSPSVVNILNGLDALLSGGTTFSSEVVGETIVITYASNSNLLTTTNSDSMRLESIGSIVRAEAADIGDLDFPPNSITKLVGSALLVTDVTNLAALVKGRYQETDSELRIRMEEREQSTGTATKPAIETSISEVEGVTSVLVIENNTLVDDIATGVPAKSYETFVVGGNDNAIAEVLWKTKPATGTTVGSVTESVVDRNGDTQIVNFSRKVERFAWMRVTYTINSEELFPANGEDNMKNSVTTFGNNLSVGEDYEPTKFYSPLYQTQGVYIQKIEIAITNLPNDVPVYQETRLPVSKTEFLSFDTSRVVVTT